MSRDRARPEQTAQPVLTEAALADFDVVAECGRGGSARVDAAVHLPSGTRVALKRWHAGVSDYARRKFLSECRLHAQLSLSPHVVRVLWAGIDGDRPWLAMELLDTTLADAVREEALPLDQALDVADDILAGLSEIHQAGSLHRDVKPANVLLRRAPDRTCAALGDLGLSMGAEESTRDVAAGTSRYLAPELLRGGRPSYRSDVFSAAVTIGAAVGPQTPDWLDKLLIKATSFDPDDRPADATEFRRLFRSARAGVEASITPQQQARPLPAARRADLLRTLAVAAAAIVLIGTVILGATAGPWRSADVPGSAAVEQTTGAVAPTPDDPVAVQEGRALANRQLRNEWAGRCAAAPRMEVRPQAVRLKTCDVIFDDQRWSLTSSGHLRTALGGCLQPADGSRLDGTPARVVECRDTEAQRWQFTSDGELSVLGDMCLDPYGPLKGPGTPLQIWGCAGLPQHQWTLV